MTKTVSNIISAVVAAIAVAGIVTVIVLACVTISPMSKVGWEDYQSVELYYGGNALSVSTDGALSGKGKNPEGYTIENIFDKMNFSLFSTCLQFNYSYGLTFEDNTRIKNNEIKAEELSSAIAQLKTSTEQKYSFIIRKKNIQETEVTDQYGRSLTIEFNTVAFSIEADKASDWPKSVSAYLYVWENLEKANDQAGENVDSYVYYKFKFSAKTGALVDALDEIYDIDSSKEIVEPKEETPEDGEDGEAQE